MFWCPYIICDKCGRMADEWSINIKTGIALCIDCAEEEEEKQDKGDYNNVG